MSQQDNRGRRRPQHSNGTGRHAAGRRNQGDYSSGRTKQRSASGARSADRSTSERSAKHPANASRKRPSTAGQKPRSRSTAPQQQRRRPNPNQPANQQRRRQTPPAPRKTSPQLIAAAVVGVIVLAVGGFLLFRHLTTKQLTVNGQQIVVGSNATPRMLVEDGVVSPTPGNLMAIDGSLLSKGDGELCSTMADGNPVGVDDPIPANTTVQIDNGKNTTEDYDEKQESIPFQKASGDTSFSGYWTGSIHLLSDGEDGTKTTRTGKQSGITVEEITKQPIDAGYVIYSAKPEDKVIALTFDDGPWDDSTAAILDILEQNNAKATFFTIGQQIKGHEDLIKREAQLGCQVLTHTYDHADGSGQGVDIGLMSSNEQVQEVEKGYKAIADVLGEEPKHILRAPGGNFNDDSITVLWDYVDAEIGWDVDTEDWSKPGSDAIAKMIMSATPGNVILMHDGGGDRSQTVAALKETLPQLVQQGYKFITIDELLAYGKPAALSSSTGSSSSSDSSSSADSTSGSSENSSSDTSSESSTTSPSDSSSESSTSSSSGSTSSSDSSTSATTSSSSSSSSNGTSSSSSTTA